MVVQEDEDMMEVSEDRQQEIEHLRSQILHDLGLVRQRVYRPKVPDRLRAFLAEHVPEVEVKPTGGGDIVRLKGDARGEG